MNRVGSKFCESESGVRTVVRIPDFYVGRWNAKNCTILNIQFWPNLLTNAGERGTIALSQ